MNCDTDKSKLERLLEKIRGTGSTLLVSILEVGLLVKHSDEIEPFYHITNLSARSGREHPSWEDLRFLQLFPNVRILEIHEDRRHRARDDAKSMPFSIDGIQNCVNLKEVYLNCLVHPILTGIEFCTNLRRFRAEVVYDDDGPMDITLLLELPFLKDISVGGTAFENEGVRVETEGLDLSGCKSLKYLDIRPTSKDLRFLGSVQLVDLHVPCSGLNSLEGLDTTRLNAINIKRNKITCIERLRGARLRRRTNPWCLKGNPIDPNVVKDVIASWI